MPTILDLRTERNNLVTLGRTILEKAEKEKRSMSAEESAQFDAHMNASDEKKAAIDALETEAARSVRLKAAEAELRSRPGPIVDREDPDPKAAAEKGTFKFSRRHNGGPLAHMNTRSVTFSRD